MVTIKTDEDLLREAASLSAPLQMMTRAGVSQAKIIHWFALERERLIELVCAQSMNSPPPSITITKCPTCGEFPIDVSKFDKKPMQANQ